MECEPKQTERACGMKLKTSLDMTFFMSSPLLSRLRISPLLLLPQETEETRGDITPVQYESKDKSGQDWLSCV